MKLLKLVGVLVGVSVMMSLVYVEEFIGCLKKIKDLGMLMLGVCDLLIFFFYLDDK